MCNMCNTTKCMKFLAKVLVIISFCMAIVAIIGYSYDLYRHGKAKHLVGWFSAGGFVVLTFLISIRLIVMHLLNWRTPHIQKYIVRILWMVPLYSLESWLALRFKDSAIYIETFRECYEAYVIYNFFNYIIALLGEESQLIVILKGKPMDRGMHVFPFNYLFGAPYWVPGPELLAKCKMGVLQYVLIKNVMAVIVFVLQSFHVYGEGHFLWHKGYAYICVLNFVSQAVALYCLAYFYNATKEELLPFRPFGKFMCVKMVVFFTWMQSILISLLVGEKANYGSDSWTGEQVSKGIQDFVICIEMFLASLAFSYAYSYEDFVSPSRARHHTPKKIKVDSVDGAKLAVLGSSESALALGSGKKDISAERLSGERWKSKSSFDGITTGSPKSVNSSSSTGFSGLGDSNVLEESQSLLSGDASTPQRGAHDPDDSDHDHNHEHGSHSKQPFLLAFLQSSIPADIWDDIKNVAGRRSDDDLSSLGEEASANANANSGSGGVGEGVADVEIPLISPDEEEGDGVAATVNSAVL